METPSSSARRITRSQTLAAISNNTSRKMEDSEKRVSKSRPKTGNQVRLIDITNDSPIVGLASERLETPNSWVAKQRRKITPGSGEALLRGQVKTLLLRVEEEAAHAKISKFSLENITFDSVLELQEERVKEVISRSLFLDFSEKSDCSFALTEQGTEDRRKVKSDGDSSIWSIQANASTQDETWLMNCAKEYARKV